MHVKTIITLIAVSVSHAVLTCTCNNGFTLGDGTTVTSKLSAFNPGCQNNIRNDCIVAGSCNNGNAYDRFDDLDNAGLTCNAQTKTSGNLCNTCNPGFHLIDSVAGGTHTRECRRVKFNAGGQNTNTLSQTSGDGSATCNSAYYKSTWVPDVQDENNNPSDESVANLRTFDTTGNSNEHVLENSEWIEDRCLPIADTCRTVANCDSAAKCANFTQGEITQDVPYTGTCEDCTEGYIPVTDACNMYAENAGSNVRCTRCERPICTNGAVEEVTPAPSPAPSI